MSERHDPLPGRDTDATIHEIVFAPPPRFDTSIGYWTGELDREVLVRALEAVTARAAGAAARLCPAGHLHLRGSDGVLAEAAVLLAELGLVPVPEGCALRGDEPP
jgi:hypothetical protein